MKPVEGTIACLLLRESAKLMTFAVETSNGIISNGICFYVVLKKH